MTVKAGARAAAHAAAVLVAALVVGAAAPARAHPEFSALGTNRAVLAAALDGRVDVTDTLLEGLLPGGDDRRRFDTDGDGRLCPAEVDAARARLRDEAPAVTVSVDDLVLTAPLEVSIELGDEPSARDAPLVIERHQSFVDALTPGRHRLRLVVAREPQHLLDTELGVVLGPGLTAPDGPDLVRFSGPRVSALEIRAATFVIERAPPPAPPRRARWLVAGAAMLVGVALAGVARRRR